MIDRRAGMEGPLGRRRTRRGGTDRRRAIRNAGAGVALAASLTVSAAPPATGASGVAGLRSLSSVSEFDVHIEAAAAEHGVSPALVRAIIQAESGFDHQAVSPAGAAGLMQLMPATARRFGVTDSLDARQNIFGGTRYLRVLLDTYRGDVSLSAAAYNAGEGAVARYKGIPPYRTTRAYVRRVNALLGARPVLLPAESKGARVEVAARRPLPVPVRVSPLALFARPSPPPSPGARLVESTTRIDALARPGAPLYWPNAMARGLLITQNR